MTLDGEEMVGSFMHAQNGKAHDIAFIKGPDNKLHHAAFKVDNWYDVLKAADLLARYDVPIEVTPTRHAITEQKQPISLIHLETVTKPIREDILPIQISLRSLGQRIKSLKESSIIEEKWLNPL